MFIQLTYLHEGQEILTVPVPEGQQPLIGRDRTSNYLVIHDPKVSRMHARLVLQGERLYVQDLGSRLGTFVDGVRVNGMAPLADGAVVTVGDVRFRVSMSERWVYGEDSDSTREILLCPNGRCRVPIRRDQRFCAACGHPIAG